MARRKGGSTHCAQGHEIVIVGRLKNGRCKMCAKRWVKNANLRRMYGIDLDDYTRLLSSQGGGCASCGGVEMLCVDHDHDTGVIRGILCHWCNVSAGLLQESSARARQLAAYMERHGR